jgi:hypothetical protein
MAPDGLKIARPFLPAAPLQAGGTHPDPQLQPFVLLGIHLGAQVQHHHHEDEQHHDGAGVDDHFQRTGKRRAQGKEDHRHGQQRDDQVEQRMHRIGVGNHPQGGQNGNRRRYVECNFHKCGLRVTVT